MAPPAETHEHEAGDKALALDATSDDLDIAGSLWQPRLYAYLGDPGECRMLKYTRRP